MLENSPVGESRSNGLSEKAVQEVTGMIRTFLDHAEDKLNAKSKNEDRIEEMFRVLNAIRNKTDTIKERRLLRPADFE